MRKSGSPARPSLLVVRPLRPRVSPLIVAVLLAGLLASVTGCAYSDVGDPSSPHEAPVAADAAAAPAVAYDVRPLLNPDRKYLGVALDGAPESMEPVDDFAAETGKRPNLLETYAAWGDQFHQERVRNAWNADALTLISWEPFEPSIAEIAGGASDDYIRKFAESVRTLNLPVAISFGHEMNSHWYPWGVPGVRPADFVRAWRHIHDVFLDVGAANVIWVWAPNVINPVPDVELEPLYPGDAYVDWIGLIGYYTRSGARTFDTLFGPTMRSVRKFADQPFIIVETAAEPGQNRRKAVADLFAGVADSRDVIGLIWFNIAKRADWRIEKNEPEGLEEFRRRVADDLFAFDVRGV